MTDDLGTLIAQCVAEKNGDKSFMLENDSAGNWSAYLGNRSQWVGLGEGYFSDFEGNGVTPTDAVRNLLGALRSGAE